MLGSGSRRQNVCEGAAMQLSREQVLAAALGLLDEAGLEQLTMRRLAAALGVQNGATYWHFGSKQDLLEAMADTLLAGCAGRCCPAGTAHACSPPPSSPSPCSTRWPTARP